MSKKLMAAGVVLALVVAVLVGVQSVSAQSTSLCQTVDLLVAAGVIAPDKVATAKAAAGCGATAPAVSITREMGVGSTGADVTALQTKLGVTPATGYFGAITKAAVVAYQTANGLPATGYVGPMTLAKLNYVAPVVVVPPTTGGTTGGSSDLEGGAGSITVSALSTYSAEDVVAGDEDKKVMAFEVEADDESDVEITSVKVELAQTVTSNSQRINQYVESVSVWLDGEKVGEADADDFTKLTGDIYTKSISLDGAVVKAGATEKFVIAVTALNNLDSGDIDDDAFTVDVLSMRFVDADGVSTTETPSANSLLKNFDFDDLSTSGDIEVKISEHSSNPDAKIVEVDDTSDTNDVLLLAVNLKATGSDITVDDLSFNITPTGANATEMFSEYKLTVDGVEVDSKSVASIASAATGVIQFTDMEDEFAVEEGDTVVVKLYADVMDTEGNFGSGDSVVAALTNTGLLAASSTIQDENGDNVAAGDRVGSVTGEAQTFYTEGISVAFVSGVGTPYTIDGDDNDRAELVIKFTVTAFGEDAYIPTLMTPTVADTNATVGTAASSATAPTTASGVAFHVQSADTGLALAALAGSTLTSTADEETNSFKVVDGATETFTLTVKVTNSATSVLDAASVRAILTGINFADEDTATGDFVFTSSMSDYKTNYTSIAN